MKLAATRASALAALIAAAVIGWSRFLGAPTSEVLPAAAAAVAVAAGWLSRRVAVGALVAWIPAGLLIAGAPAAHLLPPDWPALAVHVVDGTLQLARPRTASPGDDPWPLAAGLLLAGCAWLAAAWAASHSPSRRQGIVIFVVAALPWIAALFRFPAKATAGEGALVLIAGLLWFLPSRMAAGPAVAISAVLALASAGTAQVIAPHQPWFELSSRGGGLPSFSALVIEPTYGPLRDRRPGRSMLEIRSAKPGLWRMRTLDLFNGFVWRVDRAPTPELPQPAAMPVWTDVRVRGLRSDLAVAPGRITRFLGSAEHHRLGGGAWVLTPAPETGDRYRVRAEVVRARAAELSRAPAPSDPALRRYTRVGVPPARAIDIPLLGHSQSRRSIRALASTPYRRVAALARHLAAGASTQWDVVARVQRYLRDSGRFRYTTDVPAPGALPLVDFLLRTHAGYCQHFAGAAALLLRLAGVPARVVTGFATGVPRGGHAFQVRDLDAHEWIEVYFQGKGWVPFNPTPAAAPARVASQLDPLISARTPAARAAPRQGHWAAGALVVVLLLTSGRALQRRRRHGQPQMPSLLAGLVRRAGGRVEPSTTLRDLATELARRRCPHTAALALEAERARYSPGVQANEPRPRAQIARALVRDLGCRRAALLLLARAAPTRRR